MGSFEKLLKNPAVSKMFDLNKEDIDKLMDMHQEMKLNRKQMNENRLKINDKLPRIHLHKCWIQKMIGYFDQKIVDEDKRIQFTDTMIKEGYVTIPIGEIMNIEYPDDEDVLYAVQTHQNTDILKNIKEKAEIILKEWEKIIVYFKLHESLKRFDYVSFYRTDGIRIAETKHEITDAVDREVAQGQIDFTVHAPMQVDWEIEFEDVKELEGYSLGIKDADECTARMLYSANVVICILLILLAGEEGIKYKVTKENLNTLVKKKDNETIDLNREFKTILKKNPNADLYYIGEFEETENE